MSFAWAAFEGCFAEKQTLEKLRLTINGLAGALMENNPGVPLCKSALQAVGAGFKPAPTSFTSPRETIFWHAGSAERMSCADSSLGMGSIERIRPRRWKQVSQFGMRADVGATCGRPF
jgi:hypothetical protein